MELSILVRPKGLEPLTYWFVASHSIQLSYERMYSCQTQQLYYHIFVGLSRVFYIFYFIFVRLFCHRLSRTEFPLYEYLQPLR